jgi:hypothetical protein
MKRRSSPQPKLPPELDPVFPLPAHTGQPEIYPGDGDSILDNTKMVVVELPWRAFWMLWEHAEKRGARYYPQYVNRSDGMERAAAAYLEAVHACRSAYRGEILPLMDEDKAKRARQVRAQMLEEQKAKKKGAKPTAAASEDEPEPTTTSKPTRSTLKIPGSRLEGVKPLCRSTYVPEDEEGVIVQCAGPEGHKRKMHKGEHDGYVYEWED